MSYRIPFNRPCVAGSEIDYVVRAIADGRTCGDGPFSRRCQELIETRFGTGKALLTTSCTAALELSALLCALEPGDPVFVDIRADTLNLDERLIEAAITPRTRALWPVHYAGVACEMDDIMATARRHGLLVVEDAAQGVFATYRGRWLGTIGDLGCYSFHETKNFSCGEGGALLVNTERFRARSEILREKGTNRSQFLRGQVDKYTWVDVGSSYVPSDILAAHLLGQLEHMEDITAKRGLIFATYARGLAPLAERGLVRVPVIPAHCTTNFHMFYLLAADVEERTALIDHPKGAGIQAVFHYVPLHTSPFGRSFGGRNGQLPVTEDSSARLLRLPLHCGMTEADAVEVMRAVYGFYKIAFPVDLLDTEPS